MHTATNMNRHKTLYKRETRSSKLAVWHCSNTRPTKSEHLKEFQQENLFLPFRNGKHYLKFKQGDMFSAEKIFISGEAVQTEDK